jgi:ribosomal protein L10
VANPVKVEAVKALHGVFSKAKSAVVANYQGIDAQGITALRENPLNDFSCERVMP